jgi:hypothetical protein
MRGVPRARPRSLLASLVLATCALGLACRLPWAPQVVSLYCGDVLWGSLFFLLFACTAPRQQTSRLWLAAVTLTEAIELSQLYHSPAVDAVRGTRLGGLLLGHGFLWSDVLCVALGASLAALLDARLRDDIVTAGPPRQPRVGVSAAPRSERSNSRRS